MHIFLVFLPVRMWKVVLLLIIGLQDLGFSLHFQWLSHLRGRRRFSSLRSVDADCPLECDCPSAYPTAMYCHGCNLQHVPYVPSHIKHACLQRNQINSIQNGVFDHATNLVRVVLFHNQLESDKIGKNVFSKLRNLTWIWAGCYYSDKWRCWKGGFGGGTLQAPIISGRHFPAGSASGRLSWVYFGLTKTVYLVWVSSDRLVTRSERPLVSTSGC